MNGIPCQKSAQSNESLCCRNQLLLLPRLTQVMRNPTFTPKYFFCGMQYLALDVTANHICEICYIALDGFNLNTVHKLSSKEEKSWHSQDLKLGLLGGKQECSHCAMQPPPPKILVLFSIKEPTDPWCSGCMNIQRPHRAQVSSIS